MIPADNINDLIKELRLKASAELDKRVHDDISKALAESDKTESAFSKLNMWSAIMKSPITKLAAVAVIIIACVIGLSLWRNTGSGIALADVLTRIEQVTGYMYQMNSTTSTRGDSTTSTSTVLVSREHGIKTITKGIHSNSTRSIYHEKYWLWGLKPVTIIIIDHTDKTHFTMKLGSGANEKRVVEEFDEPRTIIKQFLNCKHRSLGRSEIDGVTVEGFQTTDPAYNYEKGFMGQTRLFGGARPEKVDVKLWVDVNTFLPVRVEEETVTTAGNRNYNISYDFRWNVVVNVSDFEPNIPSNYTNPGGDISFPTINEKAAIRGLRLFVERAKHYPANPSSQKKEFGEQVEEITGRNLWKELAEDEKTRRNNEILAPLVGFRWFYMDLVENQKDPAYYGEIVTPKDKDKILMRWKVSDNEYRVIFGDLSAETITEEKLAELEAALPK